MGYYVRFLAGKRSDPKWKLQFVSYRKQHIKFSKAKKPKKEWDVSRHRWSVLGFHYSMALVEARGRARQLNAQALLKRQEERLEKIRTEKIATQKRLDSVLPEEFVVEFEKRFIRTRDSETERGKRSKSRAHSIWQAACRMIVTVSIEPSEWFYHSYEIYDYFHQRQLSLRYLHSILKIANLWGFFISRKMARPFLPIPMPRGYERQRLIDAYYQKERNARRPSAPLCPEDLNGAFGKMNRKNYNWLYLTVWFGLRPKEVDNLHDRTLWSVETLYTGRKILWVFQTKIIALPPEDRWKPIPLLFDEQGFALKMVNDGSFKRPLVKTVKKYFGRSVDLYGGRKGFTDLMLSKGQSLENISIWMGHSTLDRTWRSYKNRRRFHLNHY